MAEQFLTLRPAEIGTEASERRNLPSAVTIAAGLHLLFIGALLWMPRYTPARVTVAHQGSIAAYVNVAPAPAGTTGAQQPVTKPRVVKAEPATRIAQEEPVSNETPGMNDSSAVGSAAAGSAQGGGPVRLTQGSVTLLKKVEPIYPRLMLAAKREGTVVLDAIINPDGTIGEVTVQSPASPFVQAAIDAVRQWRYSAPGFQAVLTVTVIFSIG